MLELEEIEMTAGPKTKTYRKRSFSRILCSRRWFQFTLRTFMIFVTLLCVGIVVTLNWVIPAERQRRAARLIEQIGGTFAFEGEKLSVTKNPAEKSTFYLARNVHRKTHFWYEHYFKQIEEAYIPDYVSGVHSLDWAIFPKLQRLIVDDSNRLYPADRFLMEINKLRQIKSLDIVSLTASSEGIRMLSQLENLQSLTLDISNIYLPEAAELAKLKKLRSFTITGCRSEGANLLRDLKTVRSVCVLVPTYGRIQIQGIQFMPGLEEADLVNTAVTEDDIRSLTTCESLKTIRVKKSLQESFSQKTLDHFKKYNIEVIGEK